MSVPEDRMRAALHQRLGELARASADAKTCDSNIRAAADDRLAHVESRIGALAPSDEGRADALQERARLHRLVLAS